MKPAAPPVVTVEVVDEETIVERGTRRVVWFVKGNAGWAHAAGWPGASRRDRDAGPGTVWEREVVLELPLGTELMRVEVRPAARRDRDALDYLRAEVRDAPRQVRRTYYRAGARGRLIAARK